MPILSMSDHIKRANKQDLKKELRTYLKSEKIVNELSKENYGHIQLLLFYYLGLLEPIKSIPNTKKSILLKIIFKANGAENIRKRLSDVGGINSSLSTEEDLELLKELFDELKIPDALKKVAFSPFFLSAARVPINALLKNQTPDVS